MIYGKKNKLSNQLNFMQKNGFHFSFTSYGIINEQNKIIGKREVFLDANYKDLYNSNFIGLNTVMVHKKLFSKLVFPSLGPRKTMPYGLSWLDKVLN